MKKATDTALTVSADYRLFIEDLKQRVLAARISAARAVTHQAILLYWDIGRGIVEKQQALGWGESVVEMVAGDLRRAFPGAKGFSPQNVWRMVQFFQFHSQEGFLSQVVREIQKTSKGGPVEPEHAGKMDFYLNVLNDQERGPDDQPSIGVILCAEKNDVEVEYVLRTKTNPIGVAVYELQSKLPGELKGKLPTAKQLADVVRAEMEEGR